MIDIPQENIQRFLEFDPTNICKTPKALWSIYFFSNLIAIPTALFGIHASVTRILLLPMSAALMIWLIYLSFGFTKKKAHCLLFIGCLYSFLSIASLLAMYKLLSTITDISTGTLVGVIVIYAVVTLLMIPFVQRLVAKGHYNRPQKANGALGISSIGFVFALIVIHSQKNHMSQNGAIQILVYCLLFFAFFGIMGEIVFFHKYYFFRHMRANTMEELTN